MLTWPGSKLAHLSILCSHITENVILSPFFGSGALEFHLARTRPHITIHASDHDELLVNFFSCLKSDPERLADIIMQAAKNPMTKEIFDSMRSRLKNGIEDVFISAAEFYLVNKLSFNGLGRCASKEKLKRFNKNPQFYIKSIRTFQFPSNLHLHHMDYRQLLSTYPNDFVFADPPYHKSITHYGLLHRKETFNHEEFCQILKNRQSASLTTYNDDEFIRELYKDFKILSIQPTTGFRNVRNGKSFAQIMIFI